MDGISSGVIAPEIFPILRPPKVLFMNAFFPAVALALSVASLPALAVESDEAMMQLAATSGCVACHSVEVKELQPGEVKPFGPPWRKVATRYKGDPAAAETLFHLVMEGTNPYNRHWKEDTSGLAMPPNAVALSAENGRKLVDWILSLPPIE